MNKFDNNIHLSTGVSSLGSAIFIFVLALLGSLLGSVIGMMLCVPFFQGSITELTTALSNPQAYPDVKLILYVSQAFGTLFGMVCLPLLYLKFILKRPISIFFNKPVGIQPVVLTVLIVLSFMMVNALFIEWNANLVFPEFLKGFEQWARAKEDQMAEMTKFLTQFDGYTEIILAFIVIAVIAPIGEELVFRGFLQSLTHNYTKNIHVAIWLSAILFSTIHMQFFGFVPRLLLGALFGYLYYWSGNLIVPILAHLVNNGFTLIMVLLAKKELIAYDIENTDTVPLPTVLIFAIITTGLLVYFRNYFFRRQVS
ncbi:CPBP family intramembrane glutamic endopeptidase [Fulvivirga sediminis]|uniref:CPBP family intramembrane metalloprotease n=1 Tax=Fulvivirga sediminis TaxID=2803949 RepID=A0A937F1Z0_9BACT|nr:CPBP family intramembrane glutamic endopeptidase [Fulvivirga sediminis]MBL3654812.1 CPBP family intramembrane metalloprotease [Fulvivirga sediminis]